MATTDWIWAEAIMDTDFALKLEKANKFNAIEKYIPLLVGKLFIHQYVYENEILVPKRTKQQIDNLVSQGKAIIVDAESLKVEDPLQATIYQQTIHHLETVEPETKINGKNWGETVSIAFARAKGIPFILSDESQLQELLDSEVNSGTDDDLQVIRLEDFILGMKSQHLNRKEAYIIWSAAQESEFQRQKFKKDLWPN